MSHPPAEGMSNYGFDLVANPAEQQILRELLTLHSFGLSPEQIAMHLDTNGYRARADRRWTPGMVQYVLRQQPAPDVRERA